ncbi:hypothetical protein SASPL_109931 [Salvia splendens]|uniref:SAUR family protein n=1 Tax=Salvia splendens TaxID=180675 RepID=A0A8X9A2A7_SALSN|nr:auxin-responsive protein SAUR72-like [Salvia splendens]KAG6425728.1 hypothetical protein SASPL_109931 [Salvia splendens]
MDSSSRKSNKIRDIVRLQQILKKWKKAAKSNATTSTTATTTNKSIKFLKKTLSFSESSSSSTAVTNAVPKGFVAVCVGLELKRFVIPTEYLSHQMFGILLREAEEEFGFQQEGVLKFPCEVEVFEKILKMMEDKRSLSSPSLVLMHDDGDNYDLIINCSSNYSPDATDLHHHPQMCR